MDDEDCFCGQDLCGKVYSFSLRGFFFHIFFFCVLMEVVELLLHTIGFKRMMLVEN